MFSIATSGGSPTTLCSFNGSNGECSLCRLDARRLDALRDDLHRAGRTTTDGTVFSIATSGGSPTTLCSFNGSNGAIAQGQLDAHRLDALRDDLTVGRR